MEQHHFKTAEFAALCGVKKDTLLHYDHIGLLKPRWVGENGYRYYSAQQLSTYDLIAALRRLDTPLAEIRDYLTRRSPEALLDLLREKQASLETERQRLAWMGDHLRETIRTVELGRQVQPGEIRIEEQPGQLLAVVKAPAFERFEESVYLLHIRKLLAWARAQGAAAETPGDIICRESLERDDFQESYYFFPVPAGTTGWETRERPAGTYAVLYHQGSYQSEYAACRRLRDWVRDRGYAIVGDLYEEDLVNYTTSADPQSYLLRLSLQIQRPSSRDDQ